ncbi:MAG: hydrogenase maturation nickel metallochaperone HypA [Bacteroidota bacterium]
MHELSIAQSILDIVCRHLPKGADARVKTIRLTIGEMAGVVTDSLTFCFSAISEGTPAQGAALEIVHVPLTVRCRACGRDSAITPEAFICPACGGRELMVTGGRELLVKEIELHENGASP